MRPGTGALGTAILMFVGLVLVGRSLNTPNPSSAPPKRITKAMASADLDFLGKELPAHYAASGRFPDNFLERLEEARARLPEQMDRDELGQWVDTALTGFDEPLMKAWPGSGFFSSFAFWQEEDLRTSSVVSLPSRVIAGNLGYLRLEGQFQRASGLPVLEKWLERFGSTDALIIDLRQAIWPTRVALPTLVSHILAPDGPPIVLGASLGFRLEKDSLDLTAPIDSLGYRLPSWPRFSEPARTAIAEFQRQFHPEWLPARADSMEWRYLVFEPDSASTRGLGGKSVALIIDERCKDACAAIAAALGALPNVTVFGTTTGREDGWTEGFWLPNGGVRITVPTAILFHADGTIADSRGVAPDSVIHPGPQPANRRLERDIVLVRAIEFLKGRVADARRQR